jgi:hypothetical protein
VTWVWLDAMKINICTCIVKVVTHSS